MSFWQMGGYAQFIWPAYGISVLGLAGAIIWTWRAYNQAKVRLKLLEERKP
jgi:heme exporter protein D